MQQRKEKRMKKNGDRLRNLQNTSSRITFTLKESPRRERKRYEYNETLKKLSYNDERVKSNSICKYLCTQIGPPEYIKQKLKDLKRE